MGFSASDIEKMKSAVPPEFRPRPDQTQWLGSSFLTVGATAPTPLKGSENNLDPLTSDKAREWASLAVTANPESSAAFMLTGAQATIQNAADQKTKQEERDADDRRFIEQTKAALAQRLAELDAELLAIDTRLNEIRQRRSEIGDQLEAIDELESLEGNIDPSNPKHAALLRRLGLTPEDAKRKDFAELLRQRKAALNGEDGKLESERNGLMTRRTQVEHDRQDVKNAQAGIENADNDEAELAAARRAQTTLGKQELGAAASLTENKAAKIIAADAVAVSEESKTFAEKSATEGATFYSDKNDLDWGSPPPAKPAGI